MGISWHFEDKFTKAWMWQRLLALKQPRFLCKTSFLCIAQRHNHQTVIHCFTFLPPTLPSYIFSFQRSSHQLLWPLSVHCNHFKAIQAAWNAPPIAPPANHRNHRNRRTPRSQSYGWWRVQMLPKPWRCCEWQVQMLGEHLVRDALICSRWESVSAGMFIIFRIFILKYSIDASVKFKAQLR